MAEQGDALVILQALNDQPSFLFLALKEGHVEVVRALLEVGGREKEMLSELPLDQCCEWASGGGASAAGGRGARAGYADHAHHVTWVTSRPLGSQRHNFARGTSTKSEPV